MAKKGIIKEFGDFIKRGNVVDMAVGVIIGGAFKGIIDSLVKDVIMPVISLATGGIDFNNWFVALDGGTYETLEAAKEAGAATPNYGTFLNVVLNFLIMALVVFVMVKSINTMREKAQKKEEPAPAPAPTTKVCPYCKSTIAIDATKCPHCTSDVEAEQN